jgi:cysteine desulfurase
MNTKNNILGLSNPENDMPMIAVSNDSACTSASIEPSHMLTAIGLDEMASFSSIRLSIGKYKTRKEMDVVI